MGTSPMCERLHDTLLQPLNAALLTERYEFNGINDARFQVGAVVRATPINKDGTAQPAIYYPLPDKMGDRHQQYLQQLINIAANFAANRDDTPADTMLKIVGSEILRDTGATQMQLRCLLPANEYETAEALFRQSPAERVSQRNMRDDGLGTYESLFSATVTALPNQKMPLYARDAGTRQSAPAAKLTPRPKSGGASTSAGEQNPKPPSKLPAASDESTPDSSPK